jgi:hypothetical protein
MYIIYGAVGFRHPVIVSAIVSPVIVSAIVSVDGVNHCFGHCFGRCPRSKTPTSRSGNHCFGRQITLLFSTETITEPRKEGLRFLLFPLVETMNQQFFKCKQ